jgi:hypothetical protein
MGWLLSASRVAQIVVAPAAVRYNTVAAERQPGILWMNDLLQNVLWTSIGRG